MKEELVMRVRRINHKAASCMVSNNPELRKCLNDICRLTSDIFYDDSLKIEKHLSALRILMRRANELNKKG